MGGAEDAWSGLARPHPVCRRLRSCAVLPLSVVCDSRRGYKRYAGVRVSLTLFLRSFVKHRISSSFLGSFTLNSNVLALSFEIHCFSAVIFFHRIIHSDWISSNFQQFSDTSTPRNVSDSFSVILLIEIVATCLRSRKLYILCLIDKLL